MNTFTRHEIKSIDVDYASLYGVLPGERDFAGAVKCSPEQPLHLNEQYMVEMMNMHLQEL